MVANESLFNEVQTLKIENQDLQMRSTLAESRLSAAQNEIEQLRETVRALQRNRFGKKSERFESEEQGLLFNEAEVLAALPAVPEESTDEQTEQIEVKAHTKARGHRKPLPENLPREIVKIELPEAEQFADDGTPLKIIGYELSEKLKYEPAKITVLEIHRAKYGVDSGDYVKTAKPVPAIIPKGIATPELLAAIVVAKYADGLPLYRMEEILTRQGIELPRSTMARWMIKTAFACRPLINVLNDRLTLREYAACDESHLQVLNEKGRRAESKSWMIVRSTPYGDKKVVLFDYEVSRGGSTMKKLFSEFTGYLQVDGLNSYDELAKTDGITRVGCNMHARRRFDEAKTTGAKEGKTLAEVGLKFYQDIYALEEEFRGKPPEVRYALRLEKSLPLWNQFKTWVDTHQNKVPRKSKIGEAFYYFTEEYGLLTAYLKDGRLEPDNGFTERAIRKFAIGRNNWMFADTADGAEASAILYSLVVTAKVNGVNTYRALVQVFTELPKAERLDEIEKLVDLLQIPAVTV
jgi:transposase